MGQTTPPPAGALADQTLAQFLDLLGAKVPAPGGGAAACLTGATAAALAHMVVSYSLGKKALAEHQPALERASQTLRRAQRMLLDLADEDARAYALVNELMRLPESDARRQREWPAAIATSTQIPLAAIAAAADLLRLMATLPGMTNRMLHSDLGIAAVLAEACARSSRWNVEVNAASLPPSQREAMLAPMPVMLGTAADLRAQIELACASAGT